MTAHEFHDRVAQNNFVLTAKFVQDLIQEAIAKERKACLDACKQVAEEKTYHYGYLQEAADACVTAIEQRGEK